jgi:hypothetical protein
MTKTLMFRPRLITMTTAAWRTITTITRASHTVTTITTVLRTVITITTVLRTVITVTTASRTVATITTAHRRRPIAPRRPRPPGPTVLRECATTSTGSSPSSRRFAQYRSRSPARPQSVLTAPRSLAFPTLAA